MSNSFIMLQCLSKFVKNIVIFIVCIFITALVQMSHLFDASLAYVYVLWERKISLQFFICTSLCNDADSILH